MRKCRDRSNTASKIASPTWVWGPMVVVCGTIRVERESDKGRFSFPVELWAYQWGKWVEGWIAPAGRIQQGTGPRQGIERWWSRRFASPFLPLPKKVGR